jgi:hypothetical protein
MKNLASKEFSMKAFNGKRLAACGFITAMALLATSCFSIPSIPHKIVFDKEVPLEDTAQVLFDEGIHVLALNGIDVDEAWYGSSFWSKESARVTIPAGETEVVYDLYWVRNDGYTYRANGLKLIYNFEAGKKYMLYFGVKTKGFGFGKKYIYGIGLSEGKKEIEFWEFD